MDDERVICESVHDYFDSIGIRTFSDPILALDELRRNVYDIVVVDYRMPRMSGLDLLIEAKKTNSYRYGILLTAYADTELLEKFINHNLIRKVLEKPLDLPGLQAVLEEATADCESERHRELEASEEQGFQRRLAQGSRNTSLPQGIFGLSGGLKPVFELVRQFAATDENVLISGETGTGKEVMARLIHAMGRRAKRLFVKINCGSIPDSLIESELFGYMRGAYSGAARDKPGKIELAEHGTLFLDEFTELKPELQARLLAVVQDKVVERLGGTKEINVDFRLIAATNRDLADAIRDGILREDLYFRLSTLPLSVPPLRSYKDDIGEFADGYLPLLALQLNRRPATLTASGLDRLKAYHWPGNIRELENVLTRALILLDKERNTISGEDLAFLSDRRAAGSVEQIFVPLEDLIIEHRLSIDEVEGRLLSGLLDRFNGDVMETARRTGIGKDRLYRLKNSRFVGP